MCYISVTPNDSAAFLMLASSPRTSHQFTDAFGNFVLVHLAVGGALSCGL